MKKFKLTDESITKYGRILYRIQALTDIEFAWGSVKNGDLGGFIENEECLSQSGNAWVFKDGIVFKEGKIRGGEIWGGEIRGGEIWGGEIRGGEIWGGTIKKDPVFIAGLKYHVTVTSQYITIGCENHTHEEWDNFDDRRILEMDGKDALKFWREWKETIMKLAKEQRND